MKFKSFLALLIGVFSNNGLASYTSPALFSSIDDHQFKYHLLKPSIYKNESIQNVILLGGGPGFSSWNLEPIQKHVQQKGFNVVLMDMIGIGENSHLKVKQPIEQWIQQIRAIHASPLLQKSKTILIGHSWGALMALLYLREHPKEIDRVILLNPVDPEKKAMQHLTDEIHQRHQQEVSAQWDDESAWEQKTEISAKAMSQMTMRQIELVLPTYFMDYAQGLRYAQQFNKEDFSIDLNVRAWKAYDAMPILYDQIKGQSKYFFLECDQDYLMPYNQQAYSQNLPLADSTVIKNCGHFPWIEQPEIFYQQLDGFLNE